MNAFYVLLRPSPFRVQTPLSYTINAYVIRTFSIHTDDHQKILQIAFICDVHCKKLQKSVAREAGAKKVGGVWDL